MKRIAKDKEETSPHYELPKEKTKETTDLHLESFLTRAISVAP